MVLGILLLAAGKATGYNQDLLVPPLVSDPNGKVSSSQESQLSPTNHWLQQVLPEGMITLFCLQTSECAERRPQTTPGKGWGDLAGQGTGKYSHLQNA